MNSIPASYLKIRWKNYKSFEDTGWITLRPLTILIGANNSGKTSFTSPLVALKQTLESPVAKTPLVPNGPFIDLGNYKNFVHRHETNRSVFFGLHYRMFQDPLESTAGKIGTYPPGGIHITLGRGITPQECRLLRHEIVDVLERSYLSHTRPNGTNRFRLKGAIGTGQMRQKERLAISNTTPTNFLITPNGALSKLTEFRKPGRRNRAKQFSDQFAHYLMAVNNADTNVRGFLHSLSYIGPLRERPQRYYRAAAEAPSTVGPRGENAPHIFRGAPALHSQINTWIKRFEFGNALTCKRVSDDMFELCLDYRHQKLNIADAGFGVSQVVPLIVQACCAGQRSMTIAEQPEIHLNPKLQCTLADLFVSMANADHRVIVETHSEHLLVRLRTLIAEGKIAADKVAIYFVERGDSASKLNLIPVDARGHISQNRWPADFFDESLREALALANAQAKSPRSK